LTVQLSSLLFNTIIIINQRQGFQQKLFNNLILFIYII
jgi:hypothetical protein